MKLLLDTHIWIWSLLDPDRLSKKVKKALETEENELWLSSISIWETLVLVEKKRLVLNEGPEEWIAKALQIAPVREAPITFEIARLSRTVLPKHKDPADRFLAATAQSLDLTLVTADKSLTETSEFPVLLNL